MKSANPENEYIPLDLRISVRRDTLRLISEMAQDMGISINEVFSFLAEDSVIDLELLEDINGQKLIIKNWANLVFIIYGEFKKVI